MAGFEFQELELKGAYLISNFYAGDNRGGFTKSFEKDIYKNAGIEFQLNETFASRSMKNVIRGLHFQTHNPQAELVSVVAGKVWDVIVDLSDHSCQSGNCSANIRILFQYYPDAFGRRRRLPSDDTCSFAFSPVTTGAYSA